MGVHVRSERLGIATAMIFDSVAGRLPAHVRLVSDVSIDTPSGQVRMDLAVVSATAAPSSATAHARVFSAIRVGAARSSRSPSSSALERSGVRCVWHIVLEPQVGYRGPVPVIFVRLRLGAAWRERFYLRGTTCDAPLCVGVDPGGYPELITVRLDPGNLAPNQGLGLLPGSPR
jgi:hypothetical protein